MMGKKKDAQWLISESWDNVLNLEDVRAALERVEEHRAYASVFPDRKQVFDAYRLTPLEEVKVVIIGQDPYPGYSNNGTPHANGLAFSSNFADIPKSLQNIFKELHLEYGLQRNTANLSDWAKQGVLLLNTSLTVTAGHINSHQGIWSKVIKDTIETISIQWCNIVFMLWGNDALQIYPYIKNRVHHLILETSHPSPMSAMKGFLGCNHFKMANEYLLKKEKEQIDWFHADAPKKIRKAE